jgi:hypothetical protein
MRTNKSIVLAIGLLSFATRSSAEDKRPVIAVGQPTVIAFFRPAAQAELNSGDTNEALSDFQYYVAKAGPELKSLGVEFHELYVDAFRIRIGKRTTIFRPGKVGVGYYFVAPGKQARIEYGVLTDDDALAISRQYFNLPLKTPKP